MRLDRRLRWVIDTFSEQLRLQRAYGLGPTDLVLDVGSGSDPSPRANVLCDKFVSDASERHGQALIIDRPFVVADLQALPFEDDAFDYAICSHVLEHVDEPARAVAELARVAKRGYVETPSASWERIAGFPFHKWLVSEVAGRLQFVAKPGPVYDPELESWFRDMLDKLGISQRLWFARRRVGVYTEFHWVGGIEADVQGTPPIGADFATAARSAQDLAPSPRPQRSRGSRLIDAWGRHLRRHSDVSWPRLQTLLRCPACRGALQDSAPQSLRCTGCQNEYVIDDAGRPHLLIEG